MSLSLALGDKCNTAFSLIVLKLIPGDRFSLTRAYHLWSITQCELGTIIAKQFTEPPNRFQLHRSCFWLWHFVLHDRVPLSVWTAVSPMELNALRKPFNFNSCGTNDIVDICTALHGYFFFLWNSFLANINSLKFALGGLCGCHQSMTGTE